MRKQQKKPSGMVMKKRVNRLKFVFLMLLILPSMYVAGQDKIDEIQNTYGSTIVRNQDSTHYIVCHQNAHWDPHFTIIDANSTSVKKCTIPKGLVQRVTDFVVKGNNIYLCGQLHEDSSWFIGRINLTNFSESHPATFDYYELTFASRLTRLQYESDRWFVVGADNNNDAILVEAYMHIDPLNPIFGIRYHYVNLVDTATNIHYMADDIIILENYIVVSSHINTDAQQFTPLTEGHLWFIENPLNPVYNHSHISSSKISHSNTLYKTLSPVYLAKMNGTRFYSSGTSEQLLLNYKHAAISWYIEREHRITVTLSDMTSSKGIAYNPVSNNVEMLTARYTGRIPTYAGCDRIYSFNAELAIGNTAVARQYSGYKIHSLAADPFSGNRFVATGEDAASGYPYHNYFIWYKRGLWTGCTNKVTSSVTKDETDILIKKTDNSPTVNMQIRDGDTVSCSWVSLTNICE